MVRIYEVTRHFPKGERFGLTWQMRRAAVSVPSDIAEGLMRVTRGEFRQFLGQAEGSLAELETQLLLAVQLGYLPKTDATIDQLSEVARMLSGLLSSLAKDP